MPAPRRDARVLVRPVFEFRAEACHAACRAGGACANVTSPRSRKSGEASLPRRVPLSQLPKTKLPTPSSLGVGRSVFSGLGTSTTVVATGDFTVTVSTRRRGGAEMTESGGAPAMAGVRGETTPRPHVTAAFRRRVWSWPRLTLPRCARHRRIRDRHCGWCQATPGAPRALLPSDPCDSSVSVSSASQQSVAPKQIRWELINA